MKPEPRAERVALSDIFRRGSGTRVVGMVHLLPLPGAPGWGGSMDEVVAHACRDAEVLANGGVDGLMVENYGDVPFFADSVPPESVAALTRATSEVERLGNIPTGVNVLRNDAVSALAIAVATGAKFIRVNVFAGTMATDQGWIRGRAAEILRLRRSLESRVAIFADVFVKHAMPPAGLTLADAARDAWDRGRADALIVSGSGTGRPTAVQDLAQVRTTVSEAPLWVGSGATAGTVGELAQLADGIIVGSAVQRNNEAGREVDPARLDQFMTALS